MTERRVLLASILSILCISLYSQALMRNTRQQLGQQAAQRPVSTPALLMPAKIEAVLPLPEEETLRVESKLLQLEVGTATGSVRRVVLKEFRNAQQTAPLQFDPPIPILSPQSSDGKITIEDVQVIGTRVSVRGSSEADGPFELTYELLEDQPIVKVAWRGSKQPPVLAVSWSRGDRLSNQQNRLEAFAVELKNGQPKHRHFGGPWKSDKNVPRGTFLLALAERHFCLVARLTGINPDLKLVPSTEDTVAALVKISQDVATGGELLQLYFGPRDYFHLKDAGVQQAFPIGILGQIGLGLLWFLSLLAGMTHNYGVAIILFSVAITVLMAPFSLLGFRSMKRMQELKPQVDKLMAQHKSDPQRANKEVFQLYKTNRVSPLGGCLPMLLQMPIFIALFQAISHYIELRGAGFLGIKDLSLPDQWVRLPFDLPILGSSVNVLPIVMAVAMYLQTRMSQQNMGSATDNPTAKMMSGPLMPAMFLVMFYQFPAGLVLYWLTNSLSSIALYRLVK